MAATTAPSAPKPDRATSRVRDATALFDALAVANGLLLEDAEEISQVISLPQKCALSSHLPALLAELMVHRFSMKSVAS